jgi:hypothetical protein
MPRLTRKSPATPRSHKSGAGDGAFKIKIRGRDDTPLSMRELREGLMEAAKRLEPYEQHHRAKWATLYLTMVDENGQAVQIDASGVWTIFPYKSAADEHGA